MANSSSSTLMHICISLIYLVLFLYHVESLNVRRFTSRSLVEDLQSHGEERLAIIILANNHEKDLVDLCQALRSLSHLPSIQKYNTTILIFNEGNFVSSTASKLSTCTSQPLLFPTVNLSTYPMGFEPYKEWEQFTKWTLFRPLSSRGEWSYGQMIRFWTVGIFIHPALRDYDIIMRIDTDSCFQPQEGPAKNEGYVSLPALPSKNIVYQSNYEGYTGSALFVRTLYDYALKYMDEHNIQPKNPELWTTISDLRNKHNKLPVFQTNFEVVRMGFFLQPEVQHWLKSLSETEPYGVFRFRWGDAQTRVFTVAMFATKDQIFLSRGAGYAHGRGRCNFGETPDFSDNNSTHVIVGSS